MTVVTAGSAGAVKRELAFIAGIALTVFWLLPLVILAMNALSRRRNSC